MGAPTVTTDALTDVIAEKMVAHGTVQDDDGNAVTQHGHCWGTSVDPDTSDSKTTLATKPNLGQFQSNITPLLPGTLYHVRAYATNGIGTSYGTDLSDTTATTIGRRYQWVEGEDFHYFDEHGAERKAQGVAVAQDPDILGHL